MFDDTTIQFQLGEPTSFEEYIGQDTAKTVATILVEAANKEGRFIPNILLSGSAGLGKTTLGKLILKDSMFTRLLDGSSVNSKTNEFATDLSDYLLIDEIHNVKPDVCDTLNVYLDNDKYHIIGCTTNPGTLPPAFRSRFRNIQLFPYTIANLVDILKGHMERKSIPPIDDDFLYDITLRSRHNPRRALQILNFFLDFISVGNQKITNSSLKQSFDLLGMDELGLVEIDKRYLAAFPEDGRSVGLQYLSAKLNVDKETIEQDIEPYLMELGYIDRTSKGRKRLN